MILRLLTFVYAWVWGVEPWKPVTHDDWLPVIMSVPLIDAPAIIGIGVLVYCIIEKIKEGKK